MKCKIALEAAKEISYNEELSAVSLKEHATRPIGGHSTVVILGDTHFPWGNDFVIKKAIELIREVKPFLVIQIGDLYDFFSQSRFPRSHNLITPRDELEKGRAAAEKMWWAVNKASPSSKKLQMMGNHDVRPIKRLIEKAPELEPFFSIKPMFEFDGVETVHDTSQEIVIEGICYQHGHKKFGEHMKYNLMPSVHGHTHRGGVSFMNLRGHIIWELDVGYLADPGSTPLQYNAQKWVYWTAGAGLIDSKGPRFIIL